ncbi:MAG TPA: winged helix-turn-helix domain-containing protein [Terriglobales bacterium]|jgi:TolB-like protein/DNA-binding winged helix-turn-helix (wHTH) protein/Flp pilus assembly protein TadD|nr:winged helix-turn-helix domain-containing protein [Terriglobales bacterium]
MLTAAPPSRVLRFDNFELDVRAAELRKAGVKIRLQGQPIQVLATLLNNAGELVTREELRAQVWPAETFVDFDHSLHNAIARIREALGDSAGTPHYIETLPRRGYRFIGAVETVGIEESPPTLTEPATDIPVAPTQSWTRTLLIAALLAILAVAGLVMLRPILSHRAAATTTVRSIAVLPLDNFSGDPAQEYFVDGMTDELITDLAKIGGLRVISRTSVMRYKGTRKALPEIARELNVDGIIEGSVMRSGQRVRITAQLLYGPTDKHLWAETYERDLGDVLSLQSEVAQAIAQQVRAQVTPQLQARLKAVHPVNPEAYDAYMRGRYYFFNAFTTPQDLALAKTNFEEAVQKDPGFALAYSGVADAYLYSALFRQVSPESAYGPAEDALRHAQRLDDNVGEIHDTLAVISWRYKWDWAAAERELNQAIALVPSYICAHEDRAAYLAFRGRRSEAEAEVAKSLELDTSVSSAMTEAAVYYQLRDFDKLVEASRRGIVLNPDEWVEHLFLGIGYEGTGKRLEAIAEYQKAVELSGGDQDATAALAHAYAGIGRKAETQKMLQDLQKESTKVFVSPYLIATLYASLGDKDTAFKLLDQAYREKSLEMSWHLKADLRIDNLRSDARFQNLLSRVGLKD